MARRRFYAPPDESDGSVINLSAEETHHLLRVLRLKPGQEAFVFDGQGREYRCRFLALRGDRAQLEILDLLADTIESPLRLTLAQALAKGEKFDLIVQKATELGVSRIVPLATEHADVKLYDKSVPEKLERWRRISLEAAKQSGRRRLVEIASPIALADFFNAADGAMLVFSEWGGVMIEDAIAGAPDLTEITAFIGPEGGWERSELALMEERGCRAVTLGPRTLRTETAAIVAITLLQHALGDLSGNKV